MCIWFYFDFFCKILNDDYLHDIYYLSSEFDCIKLLWFFIICVVLLALKLSFSYSFIHFNLCIKFDFKTFVSWIMFKKKEKLRI